MHSRKKFHLCNVTNRIAPIKTETCQRKLFSLTVTRNTYGCFPWKEHLLLNISEEAIKNGYIKRTGLNKILIMHSIVSKQYDFYQIPGKHLRRLYQKFKSFNTWSLKSTISSGSDKLDYSVYHTLLHCIFPGCVLSWCPCIWWTGCRELWVWTSDPG